jgi:hypothetical protein
MTTTYYDFYDNTEEDLEDEDDKKGADQTPVVTDETQVRVIDLI